MILDSRLDRGSFETDIGPFPRTIKPNLGEGRASRAVLASRS
jgi:hypothetical protein